jgi:hypothetical protein
LEVILSACLYLHVSFYPGVVNFCRWVFSHIEGTLLIEIFGFRFFSSKAWSWSPDSFFRLFLNINLNVPKYSIWIGRSFHVSSEDAERNVMLEQFKKLFLFGYRSNSSNSIHLWKYCPFKSCEEKSLIPNFFSRSCRICGMKLNICW